MANCLKITPESGIKFATYDALKPVFCDDAKCPQIYERFLCGSFAGLMAQTSVYPLEIAKTRMALGYTGQYRGIMHCLGDAVKTNGTYV